LYIDNEYGIPKISKIVNLTRGKVQSILEENNIKTRTRSEEQTIRWKRFRNKRGA